MLRYRKLMHTHGTRSAVCRSPAQASKLNTPSFFNTPLGLLVLSTIFVPVVANQYQQHQLAAASDLKRGETIGRLDFEIGFRLSETQARLCKGADLATPGERTAAAEEALAGLRDCSVKSREHLYPEYSEFCFPALLAELKRLVPDDRTREQLDRAIAHLTGLDTMLEVERAPLSDPRAVAGVILDHAVLARWKETTRWYFLDGSHHSPCN